MKIVIVGGTRFIGRAIVQSAHEHDVTVVNRHSELAVDADSLGEHRDRLRALEPDVVVHCVCNSEKRADELARTFDGDTQLIALGSMDGYDAFQRLVRGHADYDLPIDESSPLTAIRHYWRGIGTHVADDYDKNLMTERLMQHPRALVFRLPMVYGPHDYQLAHRHGPFIRRIVDGHSQLLLGAAEQGRLLTFGYVENIAAAVVHAFGRRDLDRGIYNLGERTVRPWRRWADLYAEAAGTTFEHAIVPDALLPGDDPLAPDAPLGHMIVSCDRFAEQTGFLDVVSLEEGIARTLAYGREHLDLLGPAPDYDAEARLVAQVRSRRAPRPTI